ncbi:MAG: SusC/RagA family TonB-linked outer membrane protein, partial [Chitinophagaceae bacterium]
NVANSVAESIQGLTPGVTVRNSGRPGGGAKIDIRGAGTFAGNNPLYIIDGMYSDATPDFNPQDVESIQVLKDASAAAIYGSRAANGVIIITTKKGREGALQITGNVRTGVQTIPKRYDLMNANEYAATAKTLYTNAGQAIPTSLTTDFNSNYNTDWQDEFFRTGNIQDYTIGVSGGTRTSNYYLSGNYFKNKGPVIGNGFERAGFRINTTGERGRVKFGENLLISYTQDDPIAGDIFINPFTDILLTPPTIPVQDRIRFATATNPEGWGIGQANAYSNTTAGNVLALQSLQQQNQYNFKLRGNFFTDVTLFKGLFYRFNLGGESSFDRFKGFRRPGTVRQGTPSPIATADENRYNFRSFLFEHTLNLERTFGVHRVSAVAGFSNQTFADEILTGQKTGFLPNGNGVYDLTNLNQGSNDAATSFANKWNIVGFLARANYNYNERYLVSLTFRRDGDSRLSTGNKWGNFYSASGAWRISRENFYHLDFLNDLKLRASYGELGNTEFLRPWQYLGLINPQLVTIFGSGSTQVPAAINTQLANSDLKWERKKTLNVGLEGSTRIGFSFTADYFIAKTSDVLTSIPIPATTGNIGGNPPVNAASLENRGFELSLTYRPKNAKIFQWDATLNFTSIRNKVTGLGDIGSKTYIQLGDARTQIGRAIGEWYVLKSDGIFQTQAEIDAYRDKNGQRFQPDAKPGDIRYISQTGIGPIDQDKDRTFVGSPWAKFESGLILNGSYKNFTLSLQLYGVYGNKIYNRPRYQLDNMNSDHNYRSGVVPWTSSNATEYPRAAINSNDNGIKMNVLPFTDRWLEDGSYLRLRNVEIGYTFNKDMLRRIGFQGARIFVSGQNLFTITKYTGYDPDITGVNIFERGLDNGQYPSLRIIMAGVNFNF